MRSASLPIVCVGLVAVIAVTGCATPWSVEQTKRELLAQVQKSAEAQEAKIAAFEKRLGGIEADFKQVAKTSGNLEASVAAVMNYARDVEKKVGSFRDLTARELDRQNAQIQQVKVSFAAVLEREAQSIEAIRTALDATMRQLQTTIAEAVKNLKQTLPASQEIIPPPPPLPKDLKETGTPPSEEAPKPK